jgi:predicted transposase YdaD
LELGWYNLIESDLASASNLERWIIESSIQQCLEQGRQQGRQEGREEGRQTGLKMGVDSGIFIGQIQAWAKAVGEKIESTQNSPQHTSFFDI